MDHMGDGKELLSDYTACMDKTLASMHFIRKRSRRSSAFKSKAYIRKYAAYASAQTTPDGGLFPLLHGQTET
jgi:hypothetical protein